MKFPQSFPALGLIGAYPKGTLPIALAMKKVAINAAIFTPQDVEG